MKGEKLMQARRLSKTVPILDSTLVNIVRMLKANSSANALFLATDTPSAGSSNLCSTHACYTHKHTWVLIKIQYQVEKSIDMENYPFSDLLYWSIHSTHSRLTCSIIPSSSCPSSFRRSFSKGFSFSSRMENLPGLWCTDLSNLRNMQIKSLMET